MKAIDLVDHTFLFIVYTDDSLSSLKTSLQLKCQLRILKNVLVFQGLKLNIAKLEITVLGTLKGVLEAACGLKTVDLKNDAIKILGKNFSYHNETKTERDFLSTVKKNTERSQCMEYKKTCFRKKDSNL